MATWNETEGTRDSQRYPLLNRVHSTHADLLKATNDDRVLDVGCGRNPATTDASTTIGIDPDPRLLRQARRRIGSGDVCRASAGDLPFDTDSFDAVFMRGVVHHLSAEQRRTTFDEVVRVLKSDGKLLILEPEPESLFRRVVWVVAGLAGHADESEHLDDAGYVTRSDIRSICADAGLQVIEQSADGSLLSPLAFVYPFDIGINLLERLYRLLPASWWSKTVAVPST